VNKIDMKRWYRGLAVAAAALCAALSLLPASVAQTADQGVAKAVSVQGSVEVQPAGQTQWQPVKLNDTFRPGDTIRVQERSRADIALLNQSVLRLNANSTITIEAPKEQKTGVINLIRGAAHFFSRGPNSLEVTTPFTVAGVRGTEFFIDLEPAAAQLTVFEGTVVAESPAGSLTMRDGQSAVAQAGKAPVERIVARPRDAVQWTLYYPPVIQDQKAPAYQAQMLLAVGAVDEARGAIRAALQATPNNADALSVQSIMTLVQGDKDQALQLAQSAVQAAPSSASALVARSYAEQARFDLQAARASAQQAVDAEPNNALAWARLAELQSSFGELDKAKAAAEKAVAADPNLSRTQTVLGFAQLTTIDISAAMQSFEQAIRLDQADPLARLGLGLAKIRGGDLDAGSREIEVAASLDPGNALVRSYLGKAYYEEKRTPRDEREYGVARQLDPKDPTPWFYDAIAKQTTNRPVEALGDLAKARELNDNRAVYRSQLLLDSDAAARAASQARIYSELGFQQRALVEGWDAVNRDPTNFSAHRFLADSYSVLPRHEIARVSELLQSQLLSPVTNTPLQPRLAEGNLLLISSGGPATASFNEFNPLFNRDGVVAQLNALGGSHSTWAGDAIVSGLFGKGSISVGYSQFKTDGFRDNADQDDKVGNVFVHYDLTPRTSIQGELRHREVDRGDSALRFFPDSVRLGERNKEDWDTVRAGVRHALSPQSTLLGSVIYQDAKFKYRDDQLVVGFFPPGSSINSSSPEKAWVAEIQHLYRSARLSLTSGLGYSDKNGKNTTFIDIPAAGTTLPILDGSTDVRHLNVYTYGNYRLTDAIVLTAGLSYDKLDGDTKDIDGVSSVNPKIGITWSPTPQTSVRAAAFKALKRTLITDQTLEVTQVAGFNQFYDDANATKSWRYGLGVDHKARPDLFVGAEISQRDNDQPFVDLTDPANPVRQVQNITEQFARAYAFWSPHRWVALTGQVLYERLETKDFVDVTGSPADLDTYRIPLGVRVFHPSGWSAGVTGTYVDQSGKFVGGVDDSERFWLLDAAVSYRLPNRRGFVSVGATNLTDRTFRYFDTDTKNPAIQPKRMAYVRVTIVLP
jgi:tetratricopeptide (TPR) repeat protein